MVEETILHSIVYTYSTECKKVSSVKQCVPTSETESLVADETKKLRSNFSSKAEP